MITLCVFPALKVRTGSRSSVGEGGATDGAFDQTGKPVLTGGGIPVFCWSSSGIHKLDALVKLLRGITCFMGSLKSLSIPVYNAGIKGIAQDIVNIAPFKQISPLGSVAQIITFSGNGSGVLAVIIILGHDVRDNFEFLFIDLIWLSVPDCIISKGRRNLVPLF